MAGRLCSLGVQHGGSGWHDQAHALRPVHDRVEVHWGEGSQLTGLPHKTHPFLSLAYSFFQQMGLSSKRVLTAQR